jgi:hypothetical protein
MICPFDETELLVHSEVGGKARPLCYNRHTC